MTFQLDFNFLVITVFGVLVSVISFFSIRTLRQVDKSQESLWEKFDDHEKRLSHIEGEHNAFVGKGAHGK